MKSADLLFTIWGKHPVEEAMQSNFARVLEILASDRLEFALTKKIPIKNIRREELTKIAGTDKHQNVGAKVELRTHETIREWLKTTEPTKSKIVLALDEIQDPQNLGSLFRIAHFFKVDALLITRDRMAPITGTVAKASAGALFSIPLIRAVNLARELEQAAEEAFWRLGLDADAPQTLAANRPPAGNLVLVLGSEGEGMRPLTIKRCDQLVKLTPTAGRESLNVGIAGAIAMYELTRETLS